MLYIIGLGLGDERDITLRGLEAVRNCRNVYMEAYTSLLSFGLSTHGLSNLVSITVWLFFLSFFNFLVLALILLLFFSIFIINRKNCTVNPLPLPTEKWLKKKPTTFSPKLAMPMWLSSLLGTLLGNLSSIAYIFTLVICQVFHVSCWFYVWFLFT